jgi:hypothetical protein
VLRYYRHYFRIRAFADPSCPSQAPVNPPDLDGAENDWVKWGARQITAKEFAALSSLTIGNALFSVGKLGSNSSNSQNVSLNHTSNFETVNGSITVKATIGTEAWIFKYVKSFDSYTASSLTLSSSLPGVTAFNYNGTVRFSTLKTGSGTYEVSCNSSSWVSINREFVTKPFTLDVTWSYVLLGNNNGTFKDCSGFFLWNGTTGWQ